MTDLPTRTLGRTGLEVSALGYGAMGLRGAQGWRGRGGRVVSPEEADAILNAVLDAGINFIDTSIDYGSSEELIGRCISHRRSEFYLASKCGCPVGDVEAAPGQAPPHSYTRENIVAGVEQSLARMKTDHLDVLQLHGMASYTLPRKHLEETGAVETMRDLQRQGKVRFIGVSSTLPTLAEHIGMGVFDTFQIPYSGLHREHEEAIAAAAKAGGGTIIRGGTARGVPADGKQEGERWELWQEAGLDEFLDGMSRMEFILRFTFSHPGLHTTIVGTVAPDHLEGNVKALAKGPLPADVYAEAKRRLAQAGTAPTALGG